MTAEPLVFLLNRFFVAYILLGYLLLELFIKEWREVERLIEKWSPVIKGKYFQTLCYVN